MLKHLVLGKTLTPLADFHKHTHEGWEIILNISGEGYDRVGDETHLFWIDPLRSARGLS